MVFTKYILRMKDRRQSHRVAHIQLQTSALPFSRSYLTRLTDNNLLIKQKQAAEWKGTKDDAKRLHEFPSYYNFPAQGSLENSNQVDHFAQQIPQKNIKSYQFLQDVVKAILLDEQSWSFHTTINYRLARVAGYASWLKLSIEISQNKYLKKLQACP